MSLGLKISRISFLLYTLTLLLVFGLTDSQFSPLSLLLKSRNHNKLDKSELTAGSRRELWKRAADEDDEKKIVGGQLANQTAYMLSLQSPSGAHRCGGVILSPRFALSAAHCFDDLFSPAVWRVVAGELNLTVDEGTEQVRRIKRIHMHHEYSGKPQWHNDIALIELLEPLNFKAGVVDSVEWKDDNKNLDCYNGEEATAFGWGKTETGNLSDALRQVVLPIIKNNVCQKQHRTAKHPKIITDAMLCAGQRGSGRDTCKGDSGGPLILHTLLIGITSYGEGCGGNYAGVYTRVSAFITWIESKINPNKPAVSTTSTTTTTPVPPTTTTTTATTTTTTTTTTASPFGSYEDDGISNSYWKADLFSQPGYGGNRLNLYGNICMNIQERAQQYLGGQYHGGVPLFNVPFPPQLASPLAQLQNNIFNGGNFVQTNSNSNQLQFHVKSVNPGQTCVRLFTNRDCVGKNVAYESGSRCLSNISKCGQIRAAQSIGPC